VQGLIPRKGGVMPAPRKYLPELRERAQRLVTEAKAEDPGLSINQAVLRIGPVADLRTPGALGPGERTLLDRLTPSLGRRRRTGLAMRV
jgi:hypothetical protein